MSSHKTRQILKENTGGIASWEISGTVDVRTQLAIVLFPSNYHGFSTKCLLVINTVN